MNDIDENCYRQFVRPSMGLMLDKMGLLKKFHRGEGDKLFYFDEATGEEKQVVDLLGGFGANIFGHNHPFLKNILYQALSNNIPFHAQMSDRHSAGKLAQALSEQIRHWTKKDSVVLFSNSGAEAIEIAIKHAEYERFLKSSQLLKKQEILLSLLKRGEIELAPQSFLALQAHFSDQGANPIDWAEKCFAWNTNIYLKKSGFVTLDQSYHGKTLGALALTASKEYCEAFSALTFPKLSLRKNDEDQWLQQIQSHGQEIFKWREDFHGLHIESSQYYPFAGLIVEPIQGEGGIHPLTPKQAQILRQIADHFEWPLIVDEIQTGMGRTGTFLASESIDLHGDYYVLSKSLGGGLCKVGATAISRDRFVDEFSMLQSSTFAEDEHSALVALGSLQLIREEFLLEKATSLGKQFQENLLAVKARYPDIIEDVRGRGLLFGVEFKNLVNDTANTTKVIIESGYFGYVVAGHLLSMGFRTAPSMSAPRVLRIEPSFYFNPLLIADFCQKLEQVCEILRRQNSGALLAPLLREPKIAQAQLKDFRRHPGRSRQDTFAPNVKQVAFVAHFLEGEHLKLADPSLGPIPTAILDHFHCQVDSYFSPVVSDRLLVTSATGQQVGLNFVGIFENPKTIGKAFADRQFNSLIDKIQQGIDLSVELGCEVIGLGGLTSVIMQNGRIALDRGATLTTGNSLTVASCMSAIQQGTRNLGIDLRKSTLGVVGAVGNIGSLYSQLLAPEVGALKLIGKPQSRSRMARLATEIKARVEGRDLDISIHEDLTELRTCDLILSATHATQPVLFPDHLGNHPCLVVDVATPRDVHPSVLSECPKAMVIQGGLIQVPHDPNFFIAGIPVEPGHTFACLAETMILGLENRKSHFSYGKLELSKVLQISEWAAKHGFQFANFRRPDMARRRPDEMQL